MSVSQIELTIGSTRGTTERVMGEVGTTAETGVVTHYTELGVAAYWGARLSDSVDGLIVDTPEREEN